MKEPALVIIKPDGMTRGLSGCVLNKFNQIGLELIAVKLVQPHRLLVEEHYSHIRDTPFFQGVVDYLLGKFHKNKKLLALIYFGVDANKQCRKMAGVTNPEEADPMSIRGAYGRVTTRGIYENVVHVSANKKDAEREIKLWFSPEEISVKIYPIQKKLNEKYKERVWA